MRSITNMALPPQLQVEQLDSRLQFAASEAAAVNRDEKLLEWKRSDFPQVRFRGRVRVSGSLC